MLEDNFLKLRISLPVKEINQKHQEASEKVHCVMSQWRHCLQSIWKEFLIFQSHCLFSAVKNVRKMVKHLDKDSKVLKKLFAQDIKDEQKELQMFRK